MPSDYLVEMRVTDTSGADIGRIRIVDGDDSFIVEFGVEGRRVGLYSVTVDKFRVRHLNILGVLEVALRTLDSKFKNYSYAGLPIEFPVQQAIEAPSSWEGL